MTLAPMNPVTRRPWRLWMAVAALAAVVGAVVLISSSGPELARTACERFVGERLDAPEAAVYSAVSVVEIGQRWEVNGSVAADGRSSPFRCQLHRVGDRWVLDDLRLLD